MTNEQLAATLALRVMGWKVAPDRFLTGNRGWMPRWRFQPATRLEDAYRLLESATPQDYTMGAADEGGFWAKIRIGGTTGEACESTQARAITLALVRALKIEMDAK
jgi:hypothetical protein